MRPESFVRIQYMDAGVWHLVALDRRAACARCNRLSMVRVGALLCSCGVAKEAHYGSDKMWYNPDIIDSRKAGERNDKE